MSLANASKKGIKARRIIQAARAASDKFKNPMFGEMYAYAVEQALEHDNPFFLRFMENLEQPPVGIEEFLDSPNFMGATDLQLWPEVRTTIIDINKEWWKGQNVANHEVILMGATGTGKCVDSETEFLTPIGWKRISDYEDDDLVGAVDSDGRLVFEKPLAYVDNPTEGFYHFSTKSVDMCITGKHRVVYTSRKSPKLRVMTGAELYDKHTASSGGWQGRIPCSYLPPQNKGLPLTESEIRLMVAVHADGHFPRHSPHTKYCKVALGKTRKIERLRSLLEGAGVQYRERLSGKYTQFTFYAPERSKSYESWWLANADQLAVVDDEVCFWDGDQKDNYYTGDKLSADFIQHVFSTQGRRATISVIDRTHKPGWVSKEYRVHRCLYPYATMASKPEQKKKVCWVPGKDSREYCFTTSTGMFVARRAGKVFVTHNSEIAKVTTAYHTHILGCLKSAQSLYGLPQATSIVFVIQAAKPHVTKKIIYMPLRNYIETMPWFQRHLRPHRLIESEMLFTDKNIRIVPGGSDSDSILGEAIIGGVIDEINFMNVIQKSKKADVGTGRAGKFDQAQAIYDAMSRRRKSRFLFRGQQIGVICCSSSTRYSGDFTDKRKQHVTDHDEKGVYIYEKAQYEVWPQERYCGDKFRVVVENEAAMDIRILSDEQKAPEGATVFEVPIEYKPDFLKDPSGALRDVVGRSVNSLNPFFRRRYKITEAVERGQARGLESFVYKDNVVLGVEGMPRVKRGHYCANPSKPRYVHIDLSATSDRCGIAMVRFDGMVDMERFGGVTETLPRAVVELAITIEPDISSEIDLAEVRTWVHHLKKTYGYPIRAVSYDGWSSLESRQQWKRRGMPTGAVSVDRTAVPYKTFRDAFNDDRIDMYPQDVLTRELYDLEYNEKDDKVDHPPSSSKDCADAACGAYYTMITRSSSWSDTGAQDSDSDMHGRMELEERFEADRPV